MGSQGAADRKPLLRIYKVDAGAIETAVKAGLGEKGQRSLKKHKAKTAKETAKGDNGQQTRSIGKTKHVQTAMPLGVDLTVLCAPEPIRGSEP
jgi:hypothetical protein